MTAAAKRLEKLCASTSGDSVGSEQPQVTERLLAQRTRLMDGCSEVVGRLGVINAFISRWIDHEPLPWENQIVLEAIEEAQNILERARRDNDEPWADESGGQS